MVYFKLFLATVKLCLWYLTAVLTYIKPNLFPSAALFNNISERIDIKIKKKMSDALLCIFVTERCVKLACKHHLNT